MSGAAQSLMIDRFGSGVNRAQYQSEPPTIEPAWEVLEDIYCLRLLSETMALIPEWLRRHAYLPVLRLMTLNAFRRDTEKASASIFRREWFREWRHQ